MRQIFLQTIYGVCLLLCCTDLWAQSRFSRDRVSDVRHRVSVMRIDGLELPFTDDLIFELDAPGLAYSLAFKQPRSNWEHSLQVHVLFSDTGSVRGGSGTRSFFYSDGEKSVEVEDVVYTVWGFYYSPTPNAGWVYGAGLDIWRIELDTVGDGKKTVEYGTPLIDGGYHWLGENVPFSFQIKVAYPWMLRTQYGYQF